MNEMKKSALYPILTKYNERFAKQGFKPYLDDITEEIRRIWAKKQSLPMSIMSRYSYDEKDGIMLSHPGWQHNSMDKVLEMVTIFRALIAKGLSEVLWINELWLKSSDNKERVGEAVQIRWQNRAKSVGLISVVGIGKNKKYLTPFKPSNNVSPIISPWITNDEIFTTFNVPPEKHAGLIAYLNAGVERFWDTDCQMIKADEFRLDSKAQAMEQLAAIKDKPIRIRLEELAALGPMYVSDVEVEDNNLVLHARRETPDGDGGNYITQGKTALTPDKKGCQNILEAISKMESVDTVFDVDTGLMGEEPGKGLAFKVKGQLITVPPEIVGALKLAIGTIAKQLTTR